MVTLTKGYSRSPSFGTGHLRLHSAPTPLQLDPGPWSEILLRSHHSLPLSNPIPRFLFLLQGPAPTSSIPEVPGAGTAALTSRLPASLAGAYRAGDDRRGKGGAPAREDLESTWGARTNGKTDKREWRREGGTGRLEGAGKGKPRSLASKSEEGVPAAHVRLVW